MTRPPFPGGIGISHLRVYDTTAPDGLAGGTPHIHTVCMEAYVVVGGTGAVHTLSSNGVQEFPLEPGAFVWFTPGTIHRLVNHGDLEIVVLMANAGLPEAGDMVITFPPAILADPTAYADAAALPDDDRTTTGPGDAPRRRRDLAVPAFLDLAAATTAGDPEPLRAFHAAAAALVRPHLGAWEGIWRSGPLAAAEATGRHLAALAAGDAGHLGDAVVHALPPPPDERRYGLLRHPRHVCRRSLTGPTRRGTPTAASCGTQPGRPHMVPQSGWYAAGRLARGDTACAERVLNELCALQYDQPGTPWHGTFARCGGGTRPVIDRRVSSGSTTTPTGASSSARRSR